MGAWCVRRGNAAGADAADRHGGSGVVVSWGCAAEVVQLAQRVVPGVVLRPRSLASLDEAAGLPPLRGLDVPVCAAARL